jgi:hypothetical protein
MPLLDSILYILIAFIFGVIFGIFVKGLTRIIFSLIIAAIFLMILIALLNGGAITSLVASIIGLGVLFFAFLLRRINSLPKAMK